MLIFVIISKSPRLGPVTHKQPDISDCRAVKAKQMLGLRHSRYIFTSIFASILIPYTTIMKARPDCVACLFKQGLNTARIVSDDPDIHMQVLAAVADWSRKLSLNNTPAAISKPVYLFAAKISGVKDPYGKIKRETNKAALVLLPELRKFVEQSSNPLDAAIHVAVAGNVIDMGIGHSFDFNREVEEILAIMKTKLAISSLGDFRNELGRGKKLLYLGDNCGEIVFDRLLVEKIQETGTALTFAVKSAPIINDATMQDARVAGITKIAKVIETGGNDVGVDWNNVSREFLKAVNDADIILAKGHGNFETCDERPENFYFLLKAKCDMVAGILDVKLGDLVFKRSHPARKKKVSGKVC